MFLYLFGYQESTNEALFGTMEKTLRLLEMGFTEHEVSLVIEKLGEHFLLQLWGLLSVTVI